MKARKFYIFVSAVALLALSSCSYEAQPPKTRGASSNYVLPAGEVPNADEIEMVNQARMEYEDATN